MCYSGIRQNRTLLKRFVKYVNLDAEAESNQG
jgi:hypothetical protein